MRRLARCEWSILRGRGGAFGWRRAWRMPCRWVAGQGNFRPPQSCIRACIPSRYLETDRQTDRCDILQGQLAFGLPHSFEKSKYRYRQKDRHNRGPCLRKTQTPCCKRREKGRGILAACETQDSLATLKMIKNNFEDPSKDTMQCIPWPRSCHKGPIQQRKKEKNISV